MQNCDLNVGVFSRLMGADLRSLSLLVVAVLFLFPEVSNAQSSARGNGASGSSGSGSSGSRSRGSNRSPSSLGGSTRSRASGSSSRGGVNNRRSSALNDSTLENISGTADDDAGTADENNDAEAAGKAALVAQQEYDRIRRLHESGSASPWAVHRARYRRTVSLLKFGILEHPEKADNYRRRIAQANVDFTELRVNLIRELYETRSVSRLDLYQVETDWEVAQLRLESLETPGQEEIYAFRIATARFEFAREEYETALRLFQRGSYSKSDMEAARERLRNEEATLNSRREKLDEAAVVERS